MKKMIFSAAIVALIAAPSYAGFAVVMTQGAYQSGQGGEFHAASSSINGDHLPGASGFQTFCVEHGETFNYGQTYDVVINTYTSLSGKGLGNAVAWLYRNFRDGTLAGYSYSPTAARKTDAGKLQNLIWYLMDEQASVPSAGSNEFIGAVEGALGDTIANLRYGGSAWSQSNLMNVRVMNLTYHSNDNIAQDMLMLIPSPGSVLLGFIGLCAMSLKRRRSAN